MTSPYITLSPSQRDAITENFEGHGSTPFYWDNQGVLNFGYGDNLSGNNNEKLSGYWVTALTAIGVSSAAIAAAEQAVSSESDTVDLDAANNALSSLSAAQINALEQAQVDYFYTNYTIPTLTNYLSNYGVQFSSLPASVQVGLEDLSYNTRGGVSFIGSGLISELQYGLDTGDYSGVAYQLSFATAPAGATSAYAFRTTADAITSLGFTYTIYGTQNITAISGGGSNDRLIEFLTYAQSNANSAYFNTGTPGVALASAINSYGAPLGFTIAGGVATVTQGTYNTNNVTFIQNAASIRYGGADNTVDLSNGQTGNNTGQGNAYFCSLNGNGGSGGALSGVTISGNASAVCTATASSSNISISALNDITGTIITGQVTLLDSGDSFNMESGTTAVLQKGVTANLQCGNLNENVTGNANGTSAVCTITGNQGALTDATTGAAITASGFGTIGVVGSNNSVNASSTTGDTITASGGGGNAITTGSGSQVSISGTGSNADTVNTSGSAIAGTSNVSVNLTGSSNTGTFGTGSYVGLLSGDQGDAINMASGGTIVTQNNVGNMGGGIISISGAGIGLTTGSNADLNLSGSNINGTFGAGSYAGLITGDQGVVVNMASGGTVVTQNNVGNMGSGIVSISGTGIGLTTGSNADLNLSGSNINGTFGAGSYAGLITGDLGDVVNMASGGTVVTQNNVGNMGSGIISISGTGIGLTTGSNADLNLSGSNINGTFGSGSYVGLLAGDQSDSLVISNGTISSQSNVSASLTGTANAFSGTSGDIITDGGGSNIFSGSGYSLVLGANSLSLTDKVAGLTVSDGSGSSGGTLTLAASGLTTTDNANGLAITDGNGVTGGSLLLGAGITADIYASGLNLSGAAGSAAVLESSNQKELFDPGSKVSYEVDTYSSLSSGGTLLSAAIHLENGNVADLTYESNSNYDCEIWSASGAALGADVYNSAGDLLVSIKSSLGARIDVGGYDSASVGSELGGYEGSFSAGDDGGYDPGVGYYGGFALTPKAVSTGSDISLIAAFDKANTDPGVTISVEAARLQAEQALATTSSAGAASAVFDGAKWASNTITWTLAVPTGSSSPFSADLSSQYEAAVQQAFKTWAAASGLNFVEVSSASTADIQIGWSMLDPTASGALGYTSFKTQSGSITPGATILLEDPSGTALAPDSNGQLAYSGIGTELEQLLLHEIGHALGLADNSDPNSIMAPILSSANTTLDSTDTGGVKLLYPSVSNLAGQSASSAASATAGSASQPATGSVVDWASLAAQTNYLVQAMAGFSSTEGALSLSPPLASASSSAPLQLAASH